ncbi:hypothetical protein M0812_29149 [Anaeramoeba flamelloides]|uniref:UDENN domain-containing protein n=1 Tax=Anaeramoeba flamelloides TaxID=1746091 RepID=A0AAV7YAA0_9EUKA|nr:hypothetical protein M0812_29149 [Anaeramoeba flamelloides]
MYPISKWVNGIFYLEYGNSIQEHTLYMDSTDVISARQLKNLTLLSYPQDLKEKKTTTFSMNLSFGSEDCFGFVYHDRGFYNPISRAKSTTFSRLEKNSKEEQKKKKKMKENDCEYEYEYENEKSKENENKNQNKNENDTNNQKAKKKKIVPIQPFLLFSSETESDSSFGSFVDSSEEVSLSKQDSTRISNNLFSENCENSKNFSKTKSKSKSKFKPKTEKETKQQQEQEQEQKQKQKQEYSGRSLAVLSPHGCYSIFKEFLVEIAEDVFHDPRRISYWTNFISTRWPKQIQLGKVCHGFKLTETVNLSVFIPGKPESIFDHYDEICWSKGYNGLGIDLYSYFSSNLDKLWHIWQIILMGQPLVIFAPNTRACSSIAMALSSMIYPFQYDGEIIPYLTRNDSNYKKILKFNSEKSFYFNSMDNSQFSLNSFIIGTTDLSLRKTLFSDWPNFLYAGINQENDLNLKKKSTNKAFQKLIMKSQPLITADKKLLKKLKKKNKQINIKKDSRYKTNLIRQHFFTITFQFLTGFELYFNTLIPEFQNIKPFFTQVLIKGFSERGFINKLKAYKLGKHFDKKLITNYEYLFRKFIHTSTFMRWYHNQQQKSGILFYKLYRQTILQINLAEVLPKETEIEIIDLFFRMSKELSTAIRLRDHRLFNKSIELMQQAINLLPKELQLNLKGKIEQANLKMKKRKKKQMKKRTNSFCYSSSSSNSNNSDSNSFNSSNKSSTNSFSSSSSASSSASSSSSSSSSSSKNSSSSTPSTFLHLPISNTLKRKSKQTINKMKQFEKIKN